MILVFLETHDGQVAPQGYELLAIGRGLAGSSPVNAIILGPLDAVVAGQLGAADRVIHIDQPDLAAYTAEAYGRALCAVVSDNAPEAVLIAHTTMGMDLGPYVAARTNRPLLAPCIGVSISPGGLVAAIGLHGGRITLRAVAGTGAVLSFSPGAGDEAAGRIGGARPIEVAAHVMLDGLRTTLVSRVAPEPSGFDLTRSERILCVGRGLGSADEVHTAGTLAARMGADLAGSRPVIDAGWLPKMRQVGKSGVRVAPKLYIAIGVSGAPEHLEGMARSDLIVAINSDPAAPIFEVAHLGAVKDLFEVMAELTLLADQ